MRAFVRFACVVCAIAAMVLAYTTAVDVFMAGFPDGAVTDYDKAVDAPLTILAWLQAGFGVLFLAIAIVSIDARARAIGLLVALIALGLVVILTHSGVPWYFGTHLRLDNGIGG
jgi:hypothetical protein